MLKNCNAWMIALPFLMAWGCNGAGDTSLTNDPAVPTAESPSASEEDVPKGKTFYTLFNTSKGDFLVAIHPGWAPLGAERFRELVETKYYDNCRFFRVLDGFMAQVGVNGDPAVSAKWRDSAIPDEPAKVSNQRGRVTYAKGGPNSRTTQIFFNYGDNRRLDPDGFAPFGEVVHGMDVLESLYKDYGEGAPYGRGPDQTKLSMRGNEYLQAEFPNLDYINSARNFDTLEAAEVAMAQDAQGGTSAAGESGTETAPAGEAPAADPTATEPPAAATPESPPTAAETPAAESTAEPTTPQ